MAKVCAVVSEKGGAGKTTLTLSLACGLRNRGAKVLCLDLDPQRSLMMWRAAAGDDADLPLVLGADFGALKETISANQSYDYIFIDTPPRADKSTSAVLRYANLALCPIQPSPLDAWAGSSTLDLIDQKMAVSEDFEAGIILTRASENRNLAKSVREGQWHGTEIPVLDASFPDREDFKASANGGDPHKNSKLRPVIDAILDEIFESSPISE